MYYAIDTYSLSITKLADRAAALKFVKRGVNSSTEIYRMPKGWRSPTRINPENMALIIAIQGKAMDVHFRR